MFKDESRNKVWEQLRQSDSKAFSHLLTSQAMLAAAKQAGVKIRNSPLNAITLVWLGVMGALHTSKNFADILLVTLKLLDDMANPLEALKRLRKKSPCKCQSKGKRKCQDQGSCRCGGKRSKHDPRGNGCNVTEEAFQQARRKLPLAFWMCLLNVLTEAFQQQHAERVRWKRFRLLMLDGSDIALPRYQKLLDHYGAAGGGTARTPQARMLMLAFAQVRLPWRYEVVPQSCHEQTAAARLLRGLSPDDLILMDRGFWSYGLFWQIQQQGAYFGIRLRAGVKLRLVKRLGPHDALMEWTPAARSSKRCSWAGQGLPESMLLRVITYQVPGFQPSAVVTNLLDPRAISRDDWTRMAAVDERGQVLQAGLYHRRWTIETMFQELKVVQGMEGELRGRTPQTIEYEIAGHVLLYLLVRWLMVEAGVKHGVCPLQLSFLYALRELDDLRVPLLLSSPQRVRIELLPRLLDRIASHRIHVQPGRHFPRPADKYTQRKIRKQRKNAKKKT
jgi:hypothetical protein